MAAYSIVALQCRIRCLPISSFSTAHMSAWRPGCALGYTDCGWYAACAPTNVPSDQSSCSTICVLGLEVGWSLNWPHVGRSLDALHKRSAKSQHAVGMHTATLHKATLLHAVVCHAHRWADAQAVHVTVEAGDALFIPEGWWHQVDSTGEKDQV